MSIFLDFLEKFIFAVKILASTSIFLANMQDFETC